ncbi:MAG: hypothetical protein KKC79_16275, partial [Gammaproteobacteria bacterium]|nr:hypothetical protein [Gammaproteobacteria bacterium]
APRDSLIAAHAWRDHEAAAFGVHRTMDATGALLGPLLAAALLWQWADRYEVLLSVSLAFAICGVLVFTLRVRNVASPLPLPATIQPASATPVSVAPARAANHVIKTLWQNTPYRRLLYAVTGLGIFTISDGMLYLMLQQQTQLPARFLPLTYVGSALIFMLAAMPISRAATCWAPWRTFLFGYLCLGAAYGLVTADWGAGNLARLTGVMVCMGLHYAATDGVLAVMIVKALTPEVRTTGLALAATCAGLAKLVASPLFGLTRQIISPQWALLGFGAGLAATTTIAAWLMCGQAPMPKAAAS